MEKKTKAKLLLLSLSLQTALLAGCDVEKEQAPVEDYDILGQGGEESSLETNLIQKIEVPNEAFSLVTEYSCDDTAKKAWRVTSDKVLYMNVKTEGLPQDYEVYIDNVHIDTFIKSKYAVMDSILQDTMDDRIHNSVMMGFPISDNTSYIGVNAIEGQNDTFIKGSFYGMNGYSNGSVEEKRYTEKDYLKLEVYANKFLIVYDLLVKGPQDKDFRNISVKSEFLVPITVPEKEIQKTK